MNAMLKRLNKKRTSKKGFTLMEMLIVVAIIAILVAVAIPTFTAALDKARAATDAANLRAANAYAAVAILSEDTPTVEGAKAEGIPANSSLKAADTLKYVPATDAEKAHFEYGDHDVTYYQTAAKTAK